MMPLPGPDRFALGRVRAAIDRVDAGLVALLAARRRLAAAADTLEQRTGVPPQAIALGDLLWRTAGRVREASSLRDA